MPRLGAYFLADDGILDMAIAFLNSFRTYNASIPLCLIPYADDIGQLASLRRQYNFSIWRDLAALQWCDGISRMFHGCAVGQYRKLAMWGGSFDKFVYIDSDTVVLNNIDFALRYLDRFDFLASHSDMPQIRRWVWKESIGATRALTERQISYAANTGFIASRRESLSRAQIRARLPGALKLAQHMELLCCEQPLLNYLIVTSGLRYGSLSTIARHVGPLLGIPLELWAGNSSFAVRDGLVIQPRSEILMMHWAGEWARSKSEGRQIPYHDLWSYYRYRTPFQPGNRRHGAEHCQDFRALGVPREKHLYQR
jgi:hypothetical protein